MRISSSLNGLGAIHGLGPWKGSLLATGWESQFPHGLPWMFPPNLDQEGMGGLGSRRGMGQDDGSDYATVSTNSGDYIVFGDGSVYSPSGSLVTDFSSLPSNLSTALNTALNTGANQTLPGLTSTPTLPSLSTGSYQTVQTSSGDYQIVGTGSGATIFDPNGNVLGSASSSSAQQTLSQASGMSPAQISAIANAVATAAKAANSIALSSQSPYLIPGTSLVYNPATGQLGSSFGLTAGQLAPTAIAGLSSMLLIGGGLLIVFMLLGKR